MTSLTPGARARMERTHRRARQSEDSRRQAVETKGRPKVAKKPALPPFPEGGWVRRVEIVLRGRSASFLLVRFPKAPLFDQCARNYQVKHGLRPAHEAEVRAFVEQQQAALRQWVPGVLVGISSRRKTVAATRPGVRKQHFFTMYLTVTGITERSRQSGFGPIPDLYLFK